MPKKINIRDGSPMTSAHGDRLEKLLLLVCGQMGLLLTAAGKAMPPGEDQEKMKAAAIEMTRELAQIYNFEFHVQ